MKKSMRLLLALLTGILLVVGLSGCKSNDLSLSLNKTTVSSDDSGNATAKGTVKGDGVLYINGQKATSQPKNGKFSADFMVSKAYQDNKVTVKYEDSKAKKSVSKKLTVKANAGAKRIHAKEQKHTDEVNNTWNQLKDSDSSTASK
ncbi:MULTISPECIES: hypothetical protein [unclassified Lacticaseibacillus]|uniref:hypothetical protein n=1 Tax=unclassified Lacticaseibacillus TaxID=2759744 RepID=UPI00194195E2|nr:MULTISPECIES: hypothetical protein [unclassified Lacticaseibacillus]